MKNRKFYLVLPLLVCPFIVVGFWLMGGGASRAAVTTVKTGLNASLPAAVNGVGSADKLSSYESAQRDSVRMVEEKKKDPNFQRAPEAEEEEIVEYRAPIVREERKTMEYPIQAEKEAVKFIEETKPDSDMAAINEALDKLMTIQHPVNVKPHSDVDKVSYPTMAVEQPDESYFGRSGNGVQKQFYSDPGKELAGTIHAVIPVEQILRTGSVVKLELRSGFSIQGKNIRAGTILFGFAALSGERLLVQIPSINYGGAIIPVSLSVYDIDGLEGIHVPGSLSREVVKQSAEKAIESTGMPGFDMSLKTQAAATGIGAMKSLLTRKVKQERVTVAAGYQVLLVNKN